MKLLTVTPLSRGVGAGTLTYYTTRSVLPGSLIEVPLRGKNVPALVVAATDITNEKTWIKQAGFSIKKAGPTIVREFLPASSMAALETVAAERCASFGSVLDSLIPKTLLSKLSTHTLTPFSGTVPPRTGTRTSRVMQMADTERFQRYKSLVRESFARKESVLVLVPTALQATRVHSVLAKGIEERAYRVTGSETPARLFEFWERIRTSTDPVVIVGTASALLIDRPDVRLVIVDQESSPHYKKRIRPYVDARVIAEHLATAWDADLVFGDWFLRIETLYRYFEHELEAIDRPLMKQEYHNEMHIVDVRRPVDVEVPLPLLAESALDALRRAAAIGRRSFVLAVRTGYAPLTVCRDCGDTLSCDRCDAPLVLREIKRPGLEPIRSFVCRRCRRTRDSQTTCDRCGGWRLESYGLGVERVAGLLKKEFPHTPLIEAHGEITKNRRALEKAIADWKKTSNGILVGTELPVPLLTEARPHVSLIASIDTLASLPDFRMNEKIFRLVSDVRRATDEILLVQTRHPDHQSLICAHTGDGIGLYRFETSLRKELGYPPFKRFLKITCQGNKDAVHEAVDSLSKRLPDGIESAIYPAFASTVRGLYRVNLLLMLPPGRPLSEELRKLLASLPPSFSLDLDPESIL